METFACTGCGTWYPSTMLTADDRRCAVCDDDRRMGVQRRGIWYMRHDSRDPAVYHVWRDCTCSRGPHSDPVAGPVWPHLSDADVADLAEMFTAAAAQEATRG